MRKNARIIPAALRIALSPLQKLPEEVRSQQAFCGKPSPSFEHHASKPVGFKRLRAKRCETTTIRPRSVGAHMLVCQKLLGKKFQNFLEGSRLRLL
jgi:hypothetical protein